jgi:hypothetical protein
MKRPIYESLEEREIDLVQSLIGTIRKETKPIDGHTDPESLHDCWNSLEEIVGLLSDFTRVVLKFKESIEATIKVREGELAYITSLEDTPHNREQKKLITGFINAYKFVLQAWDKASPLDLLPESVTIEGVTEKDGRVIYIDDEWLDPAPSQKVQNHSPSGFNWGFGGSGPCQLALAILMRYLSPRDAEAYKHSFKFGFIAGLPKSDFRKTINLRQIMRELVENQM